MSDDPNNRRAADRSRINLQERGDIDFWTRELVVSERQLRAAVDDVGDVAAAVRRHLASKTTSRASGVLSHSSTIRREHSASYFLWRDRSPLVGAR